MIIALSILILILIFVIAGKILSSFQFDKQVEELFANSKTIAGKTFTYDQLKDLPAPVQLYFKHVLKKGQPYISYISLKHDGTFKTGLDKAWMNIKGEQYFTTQKPGFIWKGTTAMFTARDMYIDAKGRLEVFIFNLFKVADSRGAQLNEGELQRWLAESVWFPTNLLPGQNIHWTAVDALVAQLSFNYRDISFTYRVSFNDANEIMEMETKRFLGESGREIWKCKLTDYKELNGILVPTVCEAIWALKKGDRSYARFNVREIVYDIPRIF